MKDELKPCPFCEGKAERREYDDLRPYEPFGLVVDHAPGCFLTFTGSEANEEFDAAWNTRATPETPFPDVMEVWREAQKIWIKEATSPLVSHSMADTAAGNVIAEAKARWEREALERAWRAAWMADPLEGHPASEDHRSAFQYGKDCAAAAIRALKEPKP